MRLFVFCLISFLGMTTAQAASLELDVKEALIVYARPNTQSEQLSQLGRGDQVPVSQKIYSGFRKVLITHQGRKKTGYIKLSSIRNSVIRQKGKPRTRASLLHQSSFGVNFTSSYLWQGARTVTTSSDETYDVGELKSLSSFLGLFFQFPVRDRTILETAILLRETHFTGEASLSGISSDKGDITLGQSLVAASAQLKFYWHREGRFWWGVRGELGRGRSVKLEISDVEVETTSSDLPFFASVHATMGWDLPVTSHLYIIPELRIGSIVNTQPYMLSAEAGLSLAYSL